MKWVTVKMRRYRGAGWMEALCPKLRARNWMVGWRYSVPRQTVAC
ncbi:hypothetical protein [Azotobacter chroococcum]|nr:hypothetical protein [Azotobacter chroococcum]